VNIFPIFIIKLIPGLLSIGHNRSFSSESRHIVYVGSTRKSSSSYERIKNAKKHGRLKASLELI
jgi:hypothetical protein